MVALALLSQAYWTGRMKNACAMFLEYLPWVSLANQVSFGRTVHSKQTKYMNLRHYLNKYGTYKLQNSLC